jgi:hypothetical protein
VTPATTIRASDILINCKILFCSGTEKLRCYICPALARAITISEKSKWFEPRVSRPERQTWPSTIRTGIAGTNIFLWTGMRPTVGRFIPKTLIAWGSRFAAFLQTENRMAQSC